MPISVCVCARLSTFHKTIMKVMAVSHELTFLLRRHGQRLFHLTYKATHIHLLDANTVLAATCCKICMCNVVIADQHN